MKLPHLYEPALCSKYHPLCMFMTNREGWGSFFRSGWRMRALPLHSERRSPPMRYVISSYGGIFVVICLRINNLILNALIQAVLSATSSALIPRETTDMVCHRPADVYSMLPKVMLFTMSRHNLPCSFSS
jgi:hypothetical protein